MKSIGLRGFTLLELIMVVAILGIISTLAISLMGSAQQETAETANIANLKRLTALAGQYRSMHNGLLPDKFDSLVRSDAEAVGADQSIGVGFNTQEFLYKGATITQVFYCGTDVNPKDNVADDGTYFKGLMDHNTTGFGNSLGLCRLTSSDVSVLRGVGITTVYDIDPTKDAFHGTPTRIERKLAAGGYVAIVNPTAGRNGQSVYADFGVSLSDTTKYPRMGGTGATAGDLNDDGFKAAVTAKRFLVFGIGPNTTWVGDQKCGLQEVPQCQIVHDGYYNCYYLVVAMPGGPNDMTDPYPCGVLDSTGKTPRGAASWATRTNN